MEASEELFRGEYFYEANTIVQLSLRSRIKYFMRNFLKLFCIVFFISGCSFYQISSEETTSDYYPAKSAGRILTLEKITQPNKIIGYVTVSAERSQEKEEILDQLKREAAKIGGDAITNVAAIENENLSKNKIARLFSNGHIRQKYRANVVVFESSEKIKDQ